MTIGAKDLLSAADEAAAGVLAEPAALVAGRGQAPGEERGGRVDLGDPARLQSAEVEPRGLDRAEAGDPVDDPGGAHRCRADPVGADAHRPVRDPHAPVAGDHAHPLGSVQIGRPLLQVGGVRVRPAVAGVPAGDGLDERLGPAERRVDAGDVGGRDQLDQLAVAERRLVHDEGA